MLVECCRRALFRPPVATSMWEGLNKRRCSFLTRLLYFYMYTAQRSSLIQNTTGSVVVYHRSPSQHSPPPLPNFLQRVRIADRCNSQSDSVCPSVSPSHSGVLFRRKKDYTIVRVSESRRKIILVSAEIKLIRIFAENHT